MRNGRFRRALLSVITGATLGLAVMLTANTIKVRAEEEGGEWVCKQNPPGGCSFDRCSGAETGNKCIFSVQQNGANCSTTANCEWKKFGLLD